MTTATAPGPSTDFDQLTTCQQFETVHRLVGPPGRPDLNHLVVGSVLGNYELTGRLSRGSTSIVYRGRHRKLRIPVAVKVLDLGSHDECGPLRRRLLTEAILLAQVNHPNVVRLWDVDEEGPFPHLVLEFVEGGTLAELLQDSEPLPASLALAIARQAAEGLAEAHKFGIVHRDVKPGNLLLARDGHVKIADLGLAIVFDARGRRVAGGEPSALPAGTAAYISPEQAGGWGEVDFRADIYSLGATLYHALTGRVPFEGRSALEMISKHLQTPLTPPGRVATGIPEECSEVVMRMMAKRPEDRFASYDELRAALGRAAGDRRAPRPLADSFLSLALTRKR
jgi:serine/threonine protein kinase